MASLSDLQLTMDTLALRTWKDYEDGYPCGLAPGETSVTDALLLELHRRFPQIAVRRLTPANEKRGGADWEWWIGSPTDGWLCLRIQAKRIYDVGYRALDHLGDKDGDYQYNTLIEGCQDTYTLPYHVFYNGWEATRFGELRNNRADLRALRNNPHYPHFDGLRSRDDDPRSRLSTDPRLPNWWGCAALPTHHVATLHSLGRDKTKRVYAPRYLSHAMPWSCLFGLGKRREPAGLPRAPRLLDRIHRNLLADTVDSAQVAQGRYGSRHVQWTQELQALVHAVDIGEGRAIRRAQLPSYAAATLALHQNRNPIEEEFTGYQAPATYALVTDTGRFSGEY
ncbi:DUF6615 family protein [Nocardia thraciensis]